MDQRSRTANDQPDRNSRPVRDGLAGQLHSPARRNPRPHLRKPERQSGLTGGWPARILWEHCYPRYCWSAPLPPSARPKMSPGPSPGAIFSLGLGTRKPDRRLRLGRRSRRARRKSTTGKSIQYHPRRWTKQPCKCAGTICPQKKTGAPEMLAFRSRKPRTLSVGAGRRVQRRDRGAAICDILRRDGWREGCSNRPVSVCSTLGSPGGRGVRASAKVEEEEERRRGSAPSCFSPSPELHLDRGPGGEWH